MCDDIFSHENFKRSIAEMSVIIARCHGGYEAQKNVLFQKFDNNLIVICPLGMASTHLDTATKMYWFPNELEKGPIKSIHKTSKGSISRIRLRDIIFRFEILPTI